MKKIIEFYNKSRNVIIVTLLLSVILGLYLNIGLGCLFVVPFLVAIYEGIRFMNNKIKFDYSKLIIAFISALIINIPI